MIVDDEANIRRTLTICLEAEGYHVAGVSNFLDAVEECRRHVYDLAFVDMRLGTADGLDLIPQLLQDSPWTKIIVITAYASVDTAVEAMRRGACDYVPKPFTPAQIKIATARVMELRSLEWKVQELQESMQGNNPETFLHTSNSKMKQALSVSRQAAPSEASILLRGESGTGKTMLARAIHGWSQRARQPFATVSCPSLSAELLESELFGHVKGAFTGAVKDKAGKVEICPGGTLFLDEIGDLPTAIQPKLLRFLQDREYERVGDTQVRKADVRIITATNQNLETAVQEGRFREDLFYRLNVIQIEIPPLRERTEDIQSLAEQLLIHFGRNNHKFFQGFTPAALEAIRTYSWPGNIRELRNVIERASILTQSATIDVNELPEKLAPHPQSIQLGDPVSLDKIEELHIRRVVTSCKSLQDAADILGIDQATLWRKRKQFGI